MKQPIKVKTYVDLDVKGISKSFADTLDKTNKSSAQLGNSMASTMFATQFKGVAPHKHFVHVFSSFKATQSLYGKKGGWIFGPMASGGPEWEETVGGRSFFFEYGRMPPGRGRKRVGRANYVNVAAEGQPPRPYMRPAKEALIPIHKKSMEKACNRLTKTLNRKYKSSSTAATRVVRSKSF